MISTRNPSALPAPTDLRRLLQSLAVLDAILCPEWDYRYYSFDSRWGEDEQMGSMRNGSGDEFFVHFSRNGCWIKGFAHEFPMSPWTNPTKTPWPEVLDGVPPEFGDCLSEPAFSVEDVTFCIWRRREDNLWQIGPVVFPSGDDPDGSEFLLSHLDGNPGTYKHYAAAYFEVDVELEAVAAVYRHDPLTPELLARLRDTSTDAQLARDIAEIGYPSRLPLVGE